MNKLVQRLANPLLQAVVIILLYLASIFVSKSIDSEQNMPWTLAIAYQLLYIVYSAIIGLINKPFKFYWIFAIIGFVGLMFINSFLAARFSGMSMDEAGTYRWIYFVLTPVFLLFIGMVTLIKKIVSLAEKDDRKFDNN
ncbi:MAG: hypothetical protein ABI844_02220 [Saprospiraceae bacterium]